jgi:hypothetical protein
MPVSDEPLKELDQGGKTIERTFKKTLPTQWQVIASAESPRV